MLSAYFWHVYMCACVYVDVLQIIFISTSGNFEADRSMLANVYCIAMPVYMDNECCVFTLRSRVKVSTQLASDISMVQDVQAWYKVIDATLFKLRLPC